MYYTKKETYSFSVPREYKAYLNFKRQLKDLGQKFLEEGGNTQQMITITTGGRFDVNDNGDILKLVQED